MRFVRIVVPNKIRASGKFRIKITYIVCAISCVHGLRNNIWFLSHPCFDTRRRRWGLLIVMHQYGLSDFSLPWYLSILMCSCCLQFFTIFWKCYFNVAILLRLCRDRRFSSSISLHVCMLGLWTSMSWQLGRPVISWWKRNFALCSTCVGKLLLARSTWWHLGTL